jgi:hypothetical protein
MKKIEYYSILSFTQAHGELALELSASQSPFAIYGVAALMFVMAIQTDVLLAMMQEGLHD